MSIRVMTAVWDNGPTKQGHLLVMLALADYSNDQFECWPSMKSIAAKARMTERGAQKILRNLEDEGWLFIQTGNGRHGCNQYRINASRLTPNDDHPERGSPRTTMQKTPNDDAETPNGGSPEPSITIIEPSENINARDAIRAELEAVASPAAVTSFIAYRRKQKGKALTETAATRQAKQLQKIIEQGGDPDDALGMAEERGWVSVQADWYFKAKGNNYDNRSEHTTPDRPANRPDPALEQIARLAGLNQASGNGGR